MQALTRFVLHHKVLVVLFWALATAAGILTIQGTTARMTNDVAMPGRSFQVDQQLVATYGVAGSQAPYLPVITVPAGSRITDATVRAGTDRAFAAVKRVLPGARVVDYATTGSPGFLTRDARSTFALVNVPTQTSFDSADPGQAIEQAVAQAVPRGWRVGLTGDTPLSDGNPAASGKGTGLMAEAMIGSVGALVILVVVFGSFLALLPLLVGGVSVLSAFLAVGGLTEVTHISQIVQFLIALIGLGVAIDYSLLVVTRWREEHTAGRSNEDAVVEAMRHAGRAVVFSGLTVAIGLLSLIVLPVPMLRSVGLGGVLVPLLSVAVAVTLLPVVLATVGPRLDWPRHRTEHRASRFWSAWARVVYRHRWVSAAAGLGILTALMVPALGLRLGDPSSAASATAGPAHSALQTLTRGGVPSGVLDPIELLTTTTAGPDAVAHRAAGLPGVYAAVAPDTPDARRAGTAIVTVLPADERSSPRGEDTVVRVQNLAADVPGVVGATGTGPWLVDFNHAVYGQFPLMLTVIGIATFLLLARAFRSILLAAKAVVFNLVSLAAAYGVLTWFWQDGHGSSAVFGIPATGAITNWVPLMVFAFLFGLSMDYEVFILTRIREEYDATGSAEHAVTEGLGRTGRLVTCAAAILLLSFVSMSTAPQTFLKILATGLGAGILVDAVVVRCLMVPAMVALLGRWNWWLPARAARVLRVAPSPAVHAARVSEEAADEAAQPESAPAV